MHKVGIMGLGFIGKMHLGSLRKTGMAEVVAVADKDPANLGQGTAKEGNIALSGDLSLEGVKVYSEGDELLADPDVEIALIGLPTNLHKEYALKAIDAGKHIMCEKPFVRHTEEGKEILEALKGYDKNFMVLQCIRFWPAYAKAHEIIKSGEYGKVVSAHFVRHSPKPTWSWKNWLLEYRCGGGALVDLHVHDVDFVNYCFGKPSKIEAAGVTQGDEGVGDIMAMYTYEGGPVVTIHGGWNFMPKYPFRMGFQMSLEKASLEFNSLMDMNLHVYPEDGSSLTPELDPADGYFLEEKYFLECLDKGEKPSMVTPESALEAVGLVEQEMAAMGA
ncbi:MAG: Gfo/Idh/MocA family oxidoreductase [Candidatus Hydrogenedentes bacterium]|nr:Gfo/Idh/MocA family oxidoreductase [Candidatus Hydrogenedentota bacterium]